MLFGNKDSDTRRNGKINWWYLKTVDFCYKFTGTIWLSKPFVYVLLIRVQFILPYLPKHGRDGKWYIWQILTKIKLMSNVNIDKIKFQAKKY